MNFTHRSNTAILSQTRSIPDNKRTLNLIQYPFIFPFSLHLTLQLTSNMITGNLGGRAFHGSPGAVWPDKKKNFDKNTVVNLHKKLHSQYRFAANGL